MDSNKAFEESLWGFGRHIKDALRSLNASLAMRGPQDFLTTPNSSLMGRGHKACPSLEILSPESVSEYEL